MPTTTISYTSTPTTRTVKPTRTPVRNSTDKPILLQYKSGTLSIAQGATGLAEKEIVSIKYGAESLYAAIGQDYVIAAKTQGDVTKEKASTLTLTLTPAAG